MTLDAASMERDHNNDGTWMLVMHWMIMIMIMVMEDANQR